MKFNYKKPFFQAIINESFDVHPTYYDEIDIEGHYITMCAIIDCNNIASHFKSNDSSDDIKMEYVCKSIFEAATKAYNSNLSEYLPLLQPKVKIFLTNSGCVILGLKTSASGSVFIIRENIIHTWGNFEISYDNWEMTVHTPIINPKIRMNKNKLSETVMAYIIVELFLQFAKVETIFIDGRKERKRKLNGQKHFSDVPFPIKIIDSRYFRNIIRTNGFKVSGHFRMQPFGPGRKKRKLIWINEFDKNGYNLKAQKH